MARWIYDDPAATYGIRDKQQDEPVCCCGICLREIYDRADVTDYNGVPLCSDCYEEALADETV